MTQYGTVSVILLAGGFGTRMGIDTPKQYLLLGGKPIALHSYDLFASMPEITEIVVVCHEAYQELFRSRKGHARTIFAFPGARRQDSVFSGLDAVSADAVYICVHDAARPLIDRQMVLRAISGASECGAATVAVPVKATIKQADARDRVTSTLDRSSLWEIQTPQVIKAGLFRNACAYGRLCQAQVTDDVSLVEIYGGPVKLVQGDYTNVKVTTPDDLIVAEALLQRQAVEAVG